MYYKDMENNIKAIRILQDAASQVVHSRPVKSEAITTLNNAVFYLLTGRVPGRTPERAAPRWCYVCDRPKSDCACKLDPNGPMCEKAGCPNDATVIMANGSDFEYSLCEHHGTEAASIHDYSFVQRLKEA